MTKKIKKYLPIVLTVLLLALAVFGIVKLTSIESRSISSLSFSRGALDPTTGVFVQNDQAIYTKDAIECQGLSIVPKFDASVSYQVFWYNFDDVYFGHTDIFEKKDSFKEKIPVHAKYCRIVVYPTFLDDNGDEIEDYKIKFYEPVKFANDLKIKVNKEQNFKNTDYYKIAKSNIAPEGTKITTLDESYQFYEPLHFYGFSTGSVLRDFEPVIQKNSFNSFRAVIKLDCSNVKEYLFSFDEDFSQPFHVWFFTQDGTALTIPAGGDIVGNTFYGEANIQKTVVVPDGAKYMLINIAPNNLGEESPIGVNEYLPRNEFTEALYN